MEDKKNDFKLTIEECELILKHIPGLVIIDDKGKLKYMSPDMAERLSRIGELREEDDYYNMDIQKLHPASKIKTALLGKEELNYYMLSGIPNISRIKPLIEDGIIKGAIDYDLLWRLSDFEQLFKKAETFLNVTKEGIKDRNRKSTDVERKTKYSSIDIVGESEKIIELKQKIYSIAESNSFVLISGETGTGKELIASAIHHLSQRGRGNFIEVNCAAIPENLVESELFGYEEGSFTGAKKDGMIGKFEAADKGTIFLDEVDQLPYHVQPKLLRVLQEREVDKIGGKTIPIDVRVIAATNKNLRGMVKDGTFREDLYYRLNVINVSSPPLRERKEDIPILTRFYLTKLNSMSDKKVNEIAQEVYDLFQRHNWPGNVRELFNALERAFAMCNGEIMRLDDFKDLLFDLLKMQKLPEKKNLQLIRDEAEREAIRESMNLCNGNKSKMAKMLGITRANLYYKLDKFNLL